MCLGMSLSRGWHRPDLVDYLEILYAESGYFAPSEGAMR